MFFAYIGLRHRGDRGRGDEEPTTRHADRHPRLLGICTALYVAVSLVVVGMVNYTEIKIDAPLAAAFRSVGQPTFATIISIEQSSA